MYAMFSYDIPDKAKIDRPAWKMRRLGFRIHKSVWVVHGKYLKHAMDYADELIKAGADVRVRKFSPASEEELRQDALDAVKADLGELTKSIEERILKGEAKLKDAEKLQDADKVNGSIQWVRSHLAYIRRALSASQEAATAFGILADLKEIYDAFGKVMGAATAQWCLDKALEAKAKKAKAKVTA